jgi:hypothetical protein
MSRNRFLIMEWDVGVDNHKVLLCHSVAGNLVPFTSPTWAHLGDQGSGSFKFGQKLWKEILDQARPRLVVALTHRVADGIFEAYGSTPKYSERRTGWGSVRWSVARGGSGLPFQTLIALPHLSRFGIFGRNPNFERAFSQEVRASRIERQS